MRKTVPKLYEMSFTPTSTFPFVHVQEFLPSNIIQIPASKKTLISVLCSSLQIFHPSEPTEDPRMPYTGMYINLWSILLVQGTINNDCMPQLLSSRMQKLASYTARHSPRFKATLDLQNYNFKQWYIITIRALKKTLFHSLYWNHVFNANKQPSLRT